MTDQTLLPPYRGLAETALEGAVADQFPLIAPNRDLWNPATCPEELLAWLAWGLSVDDWRRAWPERVRRAVVASSVEVHRRKGTIGAVRRALGALGAAIEIREWFETGDVPHTFRLDAWADDIFEAGFNVDNRLFNRLRRNIDPVKPVRAHYILRIGERFETGVYIRTAAQAARQIEIAADPAPRRHRFDTRVAVRMDAFARQTVQIDLDPSPARIRARPVVATRLISRARVISRITHDVIRKDAA